MTKRRTTTTAIDNAITDHFLFKRFELLALNQFKWTGLPSGMEERHVERVLFNEGRVLFYQDDLDGFFCLPCSPGRGVNAYGDPLEYISTGFGRSDRVDAKKCVLIENNKLRMPTRFAIEYFVNQLFEVVRTRDVNVKTLKAPFIITTDDKSVLTLKNVLEEIENNTYAVFGDKTYQLEDQIKVFQTGVKCMTGELTDVYHDILNEALTYLGINNANTDKRERLITSEAESNNQFIDSCAEMFLEARKRGAEAINDLFGLSVSVELRTPREEPVTAPEGGTNDGISSVS